MDMGRYVYIDKNSSKGRFGIGINVFTHLANQALDRVPGLVEEPVESRSGHHLQVNNSEITIHHSTVYVKVNINVKNDAKLDKIKELITNEISSSFMMVAEQIPLEVKIKVDNII